MMRGYKFVKFAVLAIISVFIIATVGQAREIKGGTKSFDKHILAAAIDTDGSSVAVPVTVIKRVNGKYIGNYSLEVPEGRRVMIVFQKVKANGTLKAKTVARFATDASGLSKTSQFTVTAGLQAIDLGFITVNSILAKPKINPLSEVDNDDDGISDLDDNDDDNDDIEDSQDDDEDGNGILDQDDDMDIDDDNKPDVIDPDDDNDSLSDKVDLNANADGILDWDGNTDSDDDSILDADDPDDDNDGIIDSLDEDRDGDGVIDRDEIDSDQDGIPDDCDDDDDNDGIKDYQDDDNNNDGTLDIDEHDHNRDGIPDDSERGHQTGSHS